VTTVDLAPSHRQRKKQATRRAIHEAAFELVEQNGLSGVTVESISEKAGVAPRTFWSYFASKENAVLDHDPTRAEAMKEALLERPADEHPMLAAREVLERDLSGRLVDVDLAFRRGQLIRREPQLMAAVAANFDEIERALEAGLAQRLGRDPGSDLLPGVLASAATGACRVALQRWGDQKGRIPLAELIDEAFGQLAVGVAPAATTPR
jgi:AcrR family transcriptional regulator